MQRLIFGVALVHVVVLAARMEPECAAPAAATTFAADLQCGIFGNYRSELYEFRDSQTQFGGGRRFWHFRWLLDFLGGTPVRNFVASSADSFGNKIEERLAPICKEDARTESRRHLLASSWSRLKRRSFTPRKRRHDAEDTGENAEASDEHAEEAPAANETMFGENVQNEVREKKEQERPAAGPVACREFAVSTFGLLVILAGWSFRMRANMKWTLPNGEVQRRTTALLRSLADTFLTTDLEVCSTETQPFHFSFAGPRLRLRPLAGSPGSKNLGGVAASLSNGVLEVHIADLVEHMMQDERDRNFGVARRTASRELLSRLLEHWASTVDEGQRMDNHAWTSTAVRQLQQLRPFFFNRSSEMSLDSMCM